MKAAYYLLTVIGITWSGAGFAENWSLWKGAIGTMSGANLLYGTESPFRSANETPKLASADCVLQKVNHACP